MPVCFAMDRIRRNHALEHATLQVLAARQPGIRLSGYSDLRGFWVYGEVSSEVLADAVQSALRRLQAGESNLAIHPHCGTNYAASGLLAGLAGWLSMLGSGSRLRDRLERLPLVVLAATLAFIVSQPLGLIIQKRLTTRSDPQGLYVLEVAQKAGNLPIHRVLTAN